MTDTTTGNRPVAELRDGGMRIALWRVEPKQAGDRARFDCKFTHQYFDEEAQQWKPVKYTRGTGENLRVAQLFQWAAHKELKLRAAEKAVDFDVPSPG